MSAARGAQAALRAAVTSARPAFRSTISTSLRSRCSAVAPLSRYLFVTPSRGFKTAAALQEKQTSPPSEGPLVEPRKVDFDMINAISKDQPEGVLLIDVREPPELQATGTIPGSVNVPISTHPNAFHLKPEQFRHLFGFDKPQAEGPGAPELVFFCKAGVRGCAAAQLAQNAGYSRVADYPGSWLDWAAKGGRAVEYDGEGEIWEREDV